MRKISIISLSLVLLAGIAVADEAKKPLSPPAKAEATIGGKKVTIAYSAPSKRGRAIMGELVPYGKVWRTGANSATTLETEGDLMIGSVHVPAGTYTLYTLPGEKEWTLIINKQTGQWGTDYDESKDLGRTKLAVHSLKNPIETFTIAIVPGSGKNATLKLSWENTEVTAPIVGH